MYAAGGEHPPRSIYTTHQKTQNLYRSDKNYVVQSLKTKLQRNLQLKVPKCNFISQIQCKSFQEPSHVIAIRHKFTELIVILRK